MQQAQNDRQAAQQSAEEAAARADAAHSAAAAQAVDTSTQEELTRLQDENKELGGQLSESTQQVQQLTAEWMAASTQVQDLQRSNEERKKDLAELTTQLEETQQSLSEAEELKGQMHDVLQELAGATLDCSETAHEIRFTKRVSVMLLRRYLYYMCVPHRQRNDPQYQREQE